ncbi:acyltransferase [Poseidonibacter lekithochrous]|uniref:acyltransferase n=1 Tax=Poseidonibacter lekithochrous TaxID=1904463 RepID=UPI000D39AFD4|nr:acyltransferase [Poseidonibacter lekithochrous]
MDRNRKIDCKKVFIFHRIINLIRRKIYTFGYRYLLKNKTLQVGFKTRICLNDIQIGKNVIIGNDVSIGTELDSGKLILEDNVVIDNNCILDCTGELIIKKNTHISGNVTIYTHSHGLDPHNKPIPNKLEIGKKCWIGKETAILQGIEKIGDNCIFGFRSLVTKNCEANTIYAGNPAKKIRHREDV